MLTWDTYYVVKKYEEVDVYINNLIEKIGIMTKSCEGNRKID